MVRHLILVFLISACSSATLTKVEDIHDIISYGLMMTPALVINEEVVSVGKIPRAAEIVTLIMNRAE